MKRAFALLIALVLLCALTACGGTETLSNPDLGVQAENQFGSETPLTTQAVTTPPASTESGLTGEGGKANVLVAYFSATGNTEGIAQYLQDILDADLYEIVPQIPYTDVDLHYSDEDCRANQEQNDPAARPAIKDVLENPEDYEVIFLGYPIWWGQAPKILYTFLESCDFDDATIIPFCTSGSSDIGSSADGLQALEPDANWLSGQRFDGKTSQEEVAAWVESLEIPESSTDVEATQTQFT